MLVPAHTAPFKSRRATQEDPGGEHRLRMCELAARDVSGVSVCAIEIDRGGVSYTVDTLRELHASHPCAELTLIVGADVADTLASWREPAQLLELARLAVAGRPGAAARAEMPERSTVLQMEPIEVSSSMIRERVARDEPIEEFVGQAVAEYIAEHGLYRARARAAR